jgi:uncharacterized protein YegP (UPF0339 family)
MFEVKQNKNGEYIFTLKAGNGQSILNSEGYTTKSACENGIESVRKNSLIEDRFQKMESSNGYQYFYLKATNGMILATSNYYESMASRDNGILSVMKNAPDAKINYL